MNAAIGAGRTAVLLGLLAAGAVALYTLVKRRRPESAPAGESSTATHHAERRAGGLECAAGHPLHWRVKRSQPALGVAIRSGTGRERRRHGLLLRVSGRVNAVRTIVRPASGVAKQGVGRLAVLQSIEIVRKPVLLPCRARKRRVRRRVRRFVGAGRRGC